MKTENLAGDYKLKYRGRGVIVVGLTKEQAKALYQLKRDNLLEIESLEPITKGTITEQSEQLRNLSLKKTWGLFKDVPINENEEIEEQFLSFPIGTCRDDIWHWFEETFNIVLGEYIYKLNK